MHGFDKQRCLRVTAWLRSYELSIDEDALCILNLISDFFELKLVYLFLFYVSETSIAIMSLCYFFLPFIFDALTLLLYCSIQLVPTIGHECIVALCILALLYLYKALTLLRTLFLLVVYSPMCA